MKLLENYKVDTGFAPQALSSTSATTSYYSFKNFDTASFLVPVAALANGESVAVQIKQATDSAGSGSKNITSATARVENGIEVLEATVALSTVLAGSKITINGITFTAHATTTTVASRQFKIDGTDSADGDALVVCINDATYGVPGVTASNVTGTVTLKATDIGERRITVTTPHSTFTIATIKSVLAVEIHEAHLDSANSFNHCAATVTTVGNITVGCVVVRGHARYSGANVFGYTVSTGSAAGVNIFDVS